MQNVNVAHCRRKEPIVAIGGGVCLDVTGLAANLYRRNTPVIKARCMNGSGCRVRGQWHPIAFFSAYFVLG